MEDWQPKVTQLVVAIAAFMFVVAVVLVVAERSPRSLRDKVTLVLFAAPALILMGVGLVYPAIRTTVLSFYDSRGKAWVGLDNYNWVFTSDAALTTIRNTLIWAVLVPLFATGIGLVYAILIDRSRYESVAKTMLFLPTAISFVGASIIWKFVYAYRPPGDDQIGVANQVRSWLGPGRHKFLTPRPGTPLG